MSNAEAAQRFAGRPDPDMVEIREALDDIARDDKRARCDPGYACDAQKRKCRN